MLGQRTAMFEFRQQVKEMGVKLDAVIVAVGESELLARCAVPCQGPLLADDCGGGIQVFRTNLANTPSMG